MKRITDKLCIGVLLPFFLSTYGCVNQNGSAKVDPIVGVIVKPVTETKFFGVNLKGEKKKFANRPDFAELYAQLVVSAEITGDLGGPDAELIRDRAKAFFGISDLTSVSTSIDIEVDGLKVPTIIPFSFTYDTSTRQWNPNFSDLAFTPWVRLKPGTAFKINLHDFASNRSTITTGSDFLGLVTSVAPAFGGSGWLVSEASKPALTDAANAIQSRFMSDLSPSVKNNYSTIIRPLQENTKSIVAHVTDIKGNKIVDITFEIKLANTLLKGALSPDPKSADDIIVKNLFNGNPDALTYLQLTGKDGNLNKILPGSQSWEFLKSTDKNIFVKACQNMKSELTSEYEFATIDRLAVLGDIISTKTSYLLDSKLFSNLSCPTEQDKAILKKIGFELVPFNRKITVTEKQLNQLAKLIKGADKNVVDDVSAMFYDQVMFRDCRDNDDCDKIEPEIVSNQQIVDILSELKADHFGCKGSITDTVGSNIGVTVAFSQKNIINGQEKSSNYVFEGRSKSNSYIDEGISYLRLRKAKIGDKDFTCKDIESSN